MNMKDVLQKIPIGEVFHCGGRTIGEGDFSLLTNLTWTTGETHTNRENMSKTSFGERILAGGIILPLMGGQASTAGVYNKIRQEYRANIIALVGYDDVLFRNPLLPGDTIYVTCEITEARPTSNPKRGVLKLRGVATKNGSQVIAEATQVFLFEV